MPVSYLLVAYAGSGPGTNVLTAKNRFIQAWVQRKRAPGKIPHHAGQWVLIGGKAGSDALPAAYQLFQDSTGIDLVDPEVASRYGLSPAKVVNLQDVSYDPFTVIYLEASESGLDALAADINRNINDLNLVEGTLAEVAVLRVAEARNRIGPVLPPQGGWGSFIVKNYYGGVAPGPFNTDVVVLTNRITLRSKESGDWYQIALRQLPDGGGPSEPKLLGLTVEGADYLHGTENTYTTTYRFGARVTIRARMDRDSSAGQVSWNNGEATGPDYVVPVNRITPVGESIKVTASLGSTRFEVNLLIRPTVRFEVDNAEAGRDSTPDRQVWIAAYSDDGPPVEIRAVMTPNTPEAYTHLQWDGGQAPRDDRNDRRLVPRNRIATPDNPVRVKATINPVVDFVVIVAPTITRLELVGPNIVDLHNGDFEVEYQAAATYTIRAVTNPNTATEHALLTWSTGAAGVNTIAITRAQIDNFGVFNSYWAELNGIGGSRTTVRVTRQPQLTAVTLTGYIFDDGAGAYHSYAIDGQFGIPNNNRITLTATTVPNDAQAWAHVQWQNPNGVGQVQHINLNAAANYALSVRVGHAPALQRQITVSQVQAWPASGLQLRVDSTVFDGGLIVPRGGGAIRGLAVRRDEPTHVGVAFARQWVRGTAHALQAPLTYSRGTNVDQNPTIGIANPPNANTNNIEVRATAFVQRANGALAPLSWSWPNQTVIQHAPPPLVLANQASNITLPAEVVYADPLYMLWEMRIGAGNWILFDATSHMLYVTLGDPTTYRLFGAAECANPTYFTSLAISCFHANGVANPANLPAALFAAFAAPHAGTGVNNNLRRKRYAAHPLLGYWNPRYPNPGSNPGQSVRNMFLHTRSNGSCLALAEIFVAMAALHGVRTLDLVEVRANVAGAGGFLVNNWTFHAPPPAAAAAYTHDLDANGPGNNGTATWGPGVVGQNNQRPPPAFRNHYIVLDTGANVLFDPSYGGAPRANRAAFYAASIAGLERPKPSRPWYAWILPCLDPPRPTAGYSRVAGAASNTILLTNRRAGHNVP